METISDVMHNSKSTLSHARVWSNIQCCNSTTQRDIVHITLYGVQAKNSLCSMSIKELDECIEYFGITAPQSSNISGKKTQKTIKYEKIIYINENIQSTTSLQRSLDERSRICIRVPQGDLLSTYKEYWVNKNTVGFGVHSRMCEYDRYGGRRDNNIVTKLLCGKQSLCFARSIYNHRLYHFGIITKLGKCTTGITFSLSDSETEIITNTNPRMHTTQNNDLHVALQKNGGNKKPTVDPYTYYTIYKQVLDPFLGILHYIEMQEFYLKLKHIQLHSEINSCAHESGAMCDVALVNPDSRANGPALTRYDHNPFMIQDILKYTVLIMCYGQEYQLLSNTIYICNQAK